MKLSPSIDHAYDHAKKSSKIDLSVDACHNATLLAGLSVINKMNMHINQDNTLQPTKTTELTHNPLIAQAISFSLLNCLISAATD